jgi:hypothetical protein
MRRPTRRRLPGTRGARLVGFATVVQVIPGTAAPCPDTAGRRRPAAADDPERAPPRTDRAQEPVPGMAAADRAAHRPRQHLPGRHLGQCRGRPKQTLPRRNGTAASPPLQLRTRLVIAWHLLSNPRRRFRDLCPGFYAARIDPNAACAATSASPKPSATPSPSSPLSDPTAHSTPAPLTSAGSRHLPTNSPISD